jgi:hypothetical protein
VERKIDLGLLAGGLAIAQMIGEGGHRQYKPEACRDRQCQ